MVEVSSGRRACNHPESFHPEGGSCRAFGCSCGSWTEPDPDGIVIKFSDQGG